MRVVGLWDTHDVCSSLFYLTSSYSTFRYAYSAGAEKEINILRDERCVLLLSIVAIISSHYFLIYFVRCLTMVQQ